MTARICSLLIGYLFGCFQTSYLYGLTKHIDIRKHGSGNAGTNNALRVMGFKAAVIVFLGDLGKMHLAACLTHHLFGSMAALLYTAVGVTLGHNFPFYMHFKGGKGIAVGAGLILLLDWRIALPAALLFFGISFGAKIISVGSLSMMTCMLVGSVILFVKSPAVLGEMAAAEAVSVVFFLWALSFWQHRSNIGRLFRGEENKVSFGSVETVSDGSETK